MIVCDKHIKIAAKVAIGGDVIKARMSCLAISKAGDIICSSSNRLLQGNRVRWSEHAEESVIRKLNRLNAFNRFRDISLFVFRISSLGISLAKPCKNCQRLISKYPLKIFYTTSSGKIEKLW
jgi:hypothetical protein